MNTSVSHFPFRMIGDLTDSNGQLIYVNGKAMRGGFMAPRIPAGGFITAGAPVEAPNSAVTRGLSPDIAESLARIERGEFSGDINQVVTQLASDVAELQRGIVSSQTAFPVRENLEAPAALLIPTDTPLRNLLPRVPGAGLAAAWRQLTELGGGWGTGYTQPGGGSAIRMFYAETGAPVEHTSVYAAKSAEYKLLGVLGSVTGLAMAAGANFQDQMARERQNQLVNTMLNEELALHYGDSTATAAPWGDGSIPLAFDGIMVLTSTSNGTPSAQVQTSVGALTTAHIDAQLTRLHDQGGRGMYMLMNSRETMNLAKLLQATGSIKRAVIEDAGNATVGFRVTKWIHPVSGELVDIYTSRFMLPGDIFYGCRYLPDGSNVAEVEVLPQVPVPLAPEKPQQIQGYVVTDLARTISQPDVHPFMISVYEVLKMRSAKHVAKSTGVTAPA